MSSLSILYSCALSGLQAPTVGVEVHLSAGLPMFTIVGLPDTGVRESKERVRSAIDSGGWDFPAGRFTVNLSPTRLPKESGRFDLPIALGVLIATDQLVLAKEHHANLPNMYFIGELSLTGALISVHSPLIIALSLYKQNPNATLILPLSDANIAARVEGLKVIGVQTLSEVVDYLSGKKEITPMTVSSDVEPSRDMGICLSDVRGQAQACYLLEVAASGGHGLILSGTPGVGKSMLAHRLPTLLPTLNKTQQLDVMAIYSLVKGVLPPPLGMAPFRAPHHSSSAVALVGGGANVLPGEISLANHGVLFLDELPEFSRQALEALREPLESGEIHLSRAKRMQSYPAQFQLIAAYNPCPCGYFGHTKKLCRCTPEQINRYQHKLSGPLLDRIDIHLTLHPISADNLNEQRAEPSAVVRKRVERCRLKQYQRQGKLNAHLNDAEVRERCMVDEKGQELLSQAMTKFSWSLRVNHRVLKIARTMADMRDDEKISAQDVAEAIMCRVER